MEFDSKNLSTDLDKHLIKLKGLKWLPWTGYYYFKTRIVVLGESQYEDGDEWQDDPSATRTLINKQFSDDKGKLYSNTEKVLLSIQNPTQQQTNCVWRSVTYWNLVQRLLPSRQERPNDEDYDNGWKLFLEIVEILKPKICIVLGKSSIGRLGYFLNNNVTRWNRNVPEFYAKEKIINLWSTDEKMKMIFINHPSGSRGFIYKHWADLIIKSAPDLKETILANV